MEKVGVVLSLKGEWHRAKECGRALAEWRVGLSCARPLVTFYVCVPMWKTPLMSLHLPRHQGDSDSIKPVGRTVYGKDVPVYSDFKGRLDRKGNTEGSIENLEGFMCTLQNKRMHFLLTLCSIEALYLDVLAHSVSVKCPPPRISAWLIY